MPVYYIATPAGEDAEKKALELLDEEVVESRGEQVTL